MLGMERNVIAVRKIRGWRPIPHIFSVPSTYAFVCPTLPLTLNQSLVTYSLGGGGISPSLDTGVASSLPGITEATVGAGAALKN